MCQTAVTEQSIAWVKQAVDGNSQAFALLSERYRKGVVSFLQRRLTNPIDAEDIAQLTFTKAFEKIASYSPQYKFSTWLHRIARNCCIDFQRSNPTNRIVSIDNVPYSEFLSQHIECSPEENIIAEQDIAAAQLLLRKLKPQYQTIIKMRYLQEYTYNEIAQHLQIPVGTVKTRLSRAKEQLVNLLMHSNLK